MVGFLAKKIMNKYTNNSNLELTKELAEDFNLLSKKDKKILIEELCDRILRKAVAKNRLSEWYCAMMIPSYDGALPLEETTKIVEYQLRETNLNEELFPKLLSLIIDTHPLKAYAMRIIKLWDQFIKNESIEAATNYARTAAYITKPIINDDLYYNETIGLIKRTLNLVENNHHKISEVRKERITQGVLEIYNLNPNKDISSVYYLIENIDRS